MNSWNSCDTRAEAWGVRRQLALRLPWKCRAWNRGTRWRTLTGLGSDWEGGLVPMTSESDERAV